MAIKTLAYAQIARADAVMEEMGVGFVDGSDDLGRCRPASSGDASWAVRWCMSPAALVLDEPTSGLDLTATFHYLDLVQAHMRKGKTLLLVTHHIHEIPPEVDRVVLLKQGKILQDGEKRSVLTEANLSRVVRLPCLIGSSQWMVSSTPWTQPLALTSFILRPTQHETSNLHRFAAP